MKTVFNSSELAHVWASGSQSYGRNARGSFSFSADEISSYQTVIARLMRKGSAVACVYDCASFSPTTCKHQARVRSALPESVKRFPVRIGARRQSLSFTPATLRDHYVGEAKRIESALPSRYAHMRARQFDDASRALFQAVEVCEFFGLAHASLDAQLAKRAAVGAESAQLLATQRARMVKAAAKKEAAEAKKNEAYIAEAVERFRNGGEVLYRLSGVPVMLREEGAEFEGYEMVTSHGARVPMDQAERAYRFACAKRAHGWHRNGETFAVGRYQLDAVNEQGVVAGCHRVTWEEVDRFAESVGWVKKGGAS